MTAVDTSVVVAGFATWHDQHLVAIRALAEGPRLPSQVLVETYAVLTRLPSPHRVPSDIAMAYLEATFPSDRIIFPSPEAITSLPRRCHEAGLSGGAIYDALVGVTCVEHDAELVTLDRRSLRNHQAMGVPARLAS